MLRLRDIFLSADCLICTADECKQNYFLVVLKMETEIVCSNSSKRYTQAEKNILLNIVKTSDGGKWHGIIWNEVATNNGKRFE